MFKDILYFLFYIRARTLKLIFRFKEIPVLLYHSVANNDWYASVDPDVFEKQMKFLKENYNVVKLEEIINHQKGLIKLPDKSVAITFDDGYEDNYKFAWPILKKYHLPFTIFVTSDLSSHKTLNNDYRRISWAQLREMLDSGVEIGGHGVTHRDLDKLSEADLRTEIVNCRKEITNKLNKIPRHFSYPGGKFNKQVIEELEKAEFKSGCTTKIGLIRKGQDVYKIKRVWVHRKLSFFAFKARLTVVSDYLAVIKK